jgi:hypothetical protein
MMAFLVNSNGAMVLTMTDNLQSQCVIANIAAGKPAKPGQGGARHAPYAFTKQGMVMLSSVLRSSPPAQQNPIGFAARIPSTAYPIRISQFRFSSFDGRAVFSPLPFKGRVGVEFFRHARRIHRSGWINLDALLFSSELAFYPIPTPTLPKPFPPVLSHKGRERNAPASACRCRCVHRVASAIAKA